MLHTEAIVSERLRWSLLNQMLSVTAALSSTLTGPTRYLRRLAIQALLKSLKGIKPEIARQPPSNWTRHANESISLRVILLEINSEIPL